MTHCTTKTDNLSLIVIVDQETTTKKISCSNNISEARPTKKRVQLSNWYSFYLLLIIHVSIASLVMIHARKIVRTIILATTTATTVISTTIIM